MLLHQNIMFQFSPYTSQLTSHYKLNANVHLNTSFIIENGQSVTVSSLNYARITGYAIVATDANATVTGVPLFVVNRGGTLTLKELEISATSRSMGGAISVKSGGTVSNSRPTLLLLLLLLL